MLLTELLTKSWYQIAWYGNILTKRSVIGFGRAQMNSPQVHRIGRIGS